jgi:mRNA interferase MazF
MAVRRGEVYFIELSPTVGREQAGRRPVVIVSNDALNAKPLVYLVVPGTNAAKAPPSPATVFVPQGEANLPKETAFLAFQTKAIDPSRIQSAPVGTLTPATMEKIDQALAWSLDVS